MQRPKMEVSKKRRRGTCNNTIQHVLFPNDRRELHRGTYNKFYFQMIVVSYIHESQNVKHWKSRKQKYQYL